MRAFIGMAAQSLLSATARAAAMAVRNWSSDASGKFGGNLAR